MHLQRSIAVLASFGVLAAALMGAAITPSPGDEGKKLDDDTNWTFSPEVQRFIDDVGWEYLDYQKSAGELVDLLEEHKDIRDQGYLFVSQVSDNVTVDIAWHGDSPLREQATAYAAELGLRVRFIERPYAWTQIDAQARSIMNDSEKYLALGFAVNSVQTLALDSTDIVVVGTFVSPTTEKSAAQASLDMPVQMNDEELQKATGVLLNALQESGPIPVRLQAENPIFPTVSRNTDTPAFWGGGFMNSHYGSNADNGIYSECSTGFSLKFGGTNAVTTARHCSPPGGSYTTFTNWGTHYGGVVSSSPDYGASRLNSTGGGRVFDGNYGSTVSVPVKGHQSLIMGSQVCTDGGNSGVHCGGVVTNLMTLWDDFAGPAFYSITALGNSGGAMAVSGDSGGPLIVPWSNGFGAVGMIQGGYTPVACPPVQKVRPGLFCGRGVVFTSIKSIADVWGASLVTG